MTVLVIAEHDNASIKGATLNTVTAAVACGAGDVHILVAGHNAGAAAQAAAASPGDRHVKTETFIRSAFNGYKTLAGFSGDYGIALEMILQRSAAGESLAQLGTPVSYLLGKTAVTGGTTTRIGYLFNTDSAKTLKPGLAGKFIFTSQAVAAPTEDTLQWNIFKELSKSVSTNGTVSGATNDLDYAWVLMASSAYGWNTQGNRVAQRLVALQNADGGFSSYGSASSVDATALALQALVGDFDELAIVKGVGLEGLDLGVDERHAVFL